MDNAVVEKYDDPKDGCDKEQMADAEALVKELKNIPKDKKTEASLLLIGFMSGLDAASVAQKS